MKSPTFSNIWVYLLWSCAWFALTLFLVLADWYAARHYLTTSDGTPLRLRWYIAARTEIPRGTKIVKDQLTSRLGRVNASANVVPATNMAIGKYALVDISKDAPLSSAILTDLPNVIPPPNGAVVPVEIRSEFADGLRPGLRLAFVQGLKMFPDDISLHGGWLLISMTVSADQKKTILKMVVPRQERKAIQFLATGEWQPVIIAANSAHEP